MRGILEGTRPVPLPAELVDAVVGVDTHRDSHEVEIAFPTGSRSPPARSGPTPPASPNMMGRSPNRPRRFRDDNRNRPDRQRPSAELNGFGTWPVPAGPFSMAA